MNSIYSTGTKRFLALLVLYGAGLWLGLWLCYELRFDFNIPPENNNLVVVGLWVVTLKLFFLWFFRQFSGLLSYFSTPDLIRIFYASAMSSSVIMIVRWISLLLKANANYVPSRGVILADFVFSIVGLCVVRMGFRMLRERYLSPQSKASEHAQLVGIIGAGDVGASLVRELTVKRGLGLHPVVFFDDDREKWNSRVHDILVLGPPEMLLEKNKLELDQIIIAMPSAKAKRMGEVVKVLQRARLKFQTVPSMDQLATGQVKISHLRPVDIQDLLGREPVKLEAANIQSILQNQIVMVTGAGGSIGSELCRQIITYHPKRLLLLEQSEVQMFQIEQELVETGHGGSILPLIADILDDHRMRYLLQRFKPTVMFHAAAHKHVPLMESQPGEAIRNNSLGTARLADLATEFGVDRFVMISTDKAINPTNVMGASKRLGEIYLQAIHASQDGKPNKTKFMAVRFGNVLGSSGSVIPTFHRQIAAGGPVKVTHPDVTRYFMTIPEAVGLVLQSAALGTGGEIFVLDMGEPVKILDLARQMIELSGLRPDEDIEIEFVGLRPGEKLFEELSYRGENYTPTSHPKIMRFICQPVPLEEIKLQIHQLTAELHHIEPNQLKQMLNQIVPEYQPYLT